MATMVKEKHREKKKSKIKNTSKALQKDENILDRNVEEVGSAIDNSEIVNDQLDSKNKQDVNFTLEQPSAEISEEHENLGSERLELIDSIETEENIIEVDSIVVPEEKKSNVGCEDVSAKLESMSIKQDLLNECIIDCKVNFNIKSDVCKDDAIPSAPVLEEAIEIPICAVEAVVPKVRTKLKCMPIEKAIHIFGENEILELKSMSEREEAIVEIGPCSGPDHPLVDLLTTFKSSLAAVERERKHISNGYIDEEKFRFALWKLERKTIKVSEKCPCGANVEFRAAFDHAELQKDKLPAARMRLEALLREVQESYCHHQHAALLAHYQIEEFIAETIKSNKNEIREALALVLQALKFSDGSSSAYAQALQRWAVALSNALLDERDLRQLLFLLHQLFRQSRSVHWAGRVVRMRVGDMPSAARLVALLDLLLVQPAVDTAIECTEEGEGGEVDTWEEVDERGAGGGVGRGRLRERDLLALLRALPLRGLLATLALFPHTDLEKCEERWWGSVCDTGGGRGVWRASAGVRLLLHVLRHALRSHAGYERVRARLRALAVAALWALAHLHMHARSTYPKDLEEKLSAELEACFIAGLPILGEELYRLPATLLADDTVKDYCLTFIIGLHDSVPRRVESLCTEVAAMSCARRVRVVVEAAVARELDHDLARIALEFLFQTGIKRKTVVCKGACDSVARELMPRLLAAHRYLHTTAFHIMADINQVEPVDPSLVQPLSAQEWRPSPDEMRGVLDDWAQRCPLLIQHLLMQIDCTPHTGLTLETQLSVGTWLCGWVRSHGETEWAWNGLRRLQLHRSSWGLPLDAPPANQPETLFEEAFAVLATDWGHCIPLICSAGAAALRRLSRGAPAPAVHALAAAMRALALSPESVSLTPAFNEIFTTLLNWKPPLVQRALGRGGQTGADMLQQVIVQQLEDPSLQSAGRSALVSAWLHGLWKVSLPVCSRLIVDVALRVCRDWRALDAHVAYLMQEDGAAYVCDGVRAAGAAPLVCEAVGRAGAAQELRALAPRLLAALAHQRAARHRVHVDNALKLIGAIITADDLMIHKTATAVLWAPMDHPAHLTLWRLFCHLYLQRPPDTPLESTPPVGPLFFSGMVKSRVLAQLKKRLLETATYHQNEAENLKLKQNDLKTSVQSKEVDDSSPARTTGTFPTLKLVDLTGEDNSLDSETSSSEDETEADKNDVQCTIEKNIDKESIDSLITYHIAAEKLLREYGHWLEEGENIRACPHHADIARFISEQALDAAWKASLPQAVQNTVSECRTPVTQQARTTDAHLTHFERAVQALLKIKDKTHRRYRGPNITSPMEEINFNDYNSVLKQVDKHIVEIENLSKPWCAEVSRVRALDAQLWAAVSALRVRSPLPRVTRSCPKNCAPISIQIAEDEWCLSPSAEREVQENRRAAGAARRRVARAQPCPAAAAAALLSLARRVRSKELAMRFLERAWRSAENAQAPAHRSLVTLISLLAERWVCPDGETCARLLSRWSSSGAAALCGALVQPAREHVAGWRTLYIALLHANLPKPAVFSYLSKFDMSYWSDQVDSSQRLEVLEALVNAAQRWGPNPDAEHQMLIELAGMHCAGVCGGAEVAGHTCGVSRACAARTVAPAFAAHLARLAEARASHLSFDQLGHLLRDLGVIWWEARTKTSNFSYAAYSQHFADLLRSLQRAFIAAAVHLTYAPDKISMYAWSSVRESWAAWVLPHALPPLLPSIGDGERYTHMLNCFVDTILQIMRDCPGIGPPLLRCVWEWAVVAQTGALGGAQECQVQAGALRHALARLPWHTPWASADCLQLAMQVSLVNDREITAWCSSTLNATTCDTWLHGIADNQLVPTLAALFTVYTSRNLPFSDQALEEICGLPWFRLPEEVLDQLLERFFIEHHNLAIPYHETRQFKVLLSACSLSARAPIGWGPRAGVSRARAISQWVRAASAPALAPHLRGHTACLLDTVALLEPHIGFLDGELEELLSRAIVLLCMEPTAAIALPVWERWASVCSARLRRACAAAVSTLTHAASFAALADLVARTHLADGSEGCGWEMVVRAWRGVAWAEAAQLAARAPHAAYAVLLAHPHSLAQRNKLLNALATAQMSTTENEVIFALWICAVCRIGREASEAARGNVEGGEAGEEGEGGEVAEAARRAVAQWGEPRRSLLHLLPWHQPPGPTHRHRLLCNLAQCILSPSESVVKTYESACISVIGSSPGDVLTWGRCPNPKSLPRLAIRLYPHHEIYFEKELELAPDITL